MREHRKIARAASVVGGATLLSRIFGFIRDMVVAQLFGAGVATDAFFVAFRIPNLLRRLVGEGSLTASFIPVYSEYMHQRPKEEGDELVSSSFSVLALALILLTALGMLLAPWIIKGMAYGFSLEPEKFKLTVWLTRLMFPYIFFIGLVALAMGVLNSWKHFAAPALAPVLLNLSIIGCALLLAARLKEPILSLAIGVLLGGLIQLLSQVPFILRKGIRLRFLFRPFHPGVRKIALLMGPSVLGLGVTQLNVLISTFLASYLPEGSVSYLYYADRLLEFPMGIFAIAIATAILPTMSEQTTQNDLQGMKTTLSLALRFVFFVTLPAMVGLIVLRLPIIDLLFQRGAFQAYAAGMTAQALLYYALGLPAFAGIRIIVPAFYSLQDARTPVKVACLALLVNAGCGAILMNPLKHGGLALATSLAAVLNFTFLVILLRRKLGRIGGKEVFYSFLKSFGASLAMGLAAFAVASIGPGPTSDVMGKILLLLGSVFLGMIVYGGISYILGGEEIRFAMSIVSEKLRKNSG